MVSVDVVSVLLYTCAYGIIKQSRHDLDFPVKTFHYLLSLQVKTMAPLISWVNRSFGYSVGGIQ